MRKSPSVISVQGSRTFTAADLLTWQRIATLCLESPYDPVLPSKIQVRAGAVRGPNAQVGFPNIYATSFELALVPYHLNVMTSDPMVPEDAVCVAWLWGQRGGALGEFAPQASPYFALANGLPTPNGWIMSHCGVLAPRWDVWARCGMVAGETATPILWTQITAEIGGNQDQIGERINPLCTVPPHDPYDAVENGGFWSTFPIVAPALGQAPTPQPSTSPAWWRSRRYQRVILPAIGVPVPFAIVAGGPWGLSTYFDITGGVAESFYLTWWGELGISGPFQTYVQGAALGGIAGFNYFIGNNTLNCAYHPMVLPQHIGMSGTNTGVANKTITTEVYVHRGIK